MKEPLRMKKALCQFHGKEKGYKVQNYAHEKMLLASFNILYFLGQNHARSMTKHVLIIWQYYKKA